MTHASEEARPLARYISTTIPYVNAAPHVGFALELVQTDSLARYYRARGDQVRASTGSDDHSLKSVRAAALTGESVTAVVRRNSSAFRAQGPLLQARFDEFISTSGDLRHRPSVERLFRACKANGDLYRRAYRAAYCVDCEQFYRDEELEQGVCPEHGRATEVLEEENWFFRLSRYQEKLAAAIRSGTIRILPAARRQEVLSFVERGLSDFSVSRVASRAHGLGIGVPDDPSQVVYVWFDALANYLSVGGYGDPSAPCEWERVGRRVHVLGKGVLRFHAVYWPAILLSAGLPLPDELRVHGYLTLEGKKIGKSAGNAVDPRDLVRDYGATALRYYLLRHIPPFKDADFARQRLVEAHDSELADELGNLSLRVTSLVQRHLDGIAPALGEFAEREQQLEQIAAGLLARLDRHVGDHEFDLALDAIWELVRATNRYIDATQPWQLARSAITDAALRARLASVLAVGLAALHVLAACLAAFLPELAAKLSLALGRAVAPLALNSTSLVWHAPRGETLRPPEPLVPRIRERRSA